jgi:hypothetical protein
VEVFLDDNDDQVETLQSLVTATADIDGDWIATLPRVLTDTERARTASTTRDFGVIGDFEVGTTSDFSRLYAAGVAVTGVTIDGPTTGEVDTAYTFTATIQPINATQPITYVWRATGQDPMTRTNGLSDTVGFVWEMSGPQAITVTAINIVDSVEGTYSVDVTGTGSFEIYLPIALRNN